MHRDLHGHIYFPVQAVSLLSEPGQDFTGREFVLIQQIPDGPSTAMVVRPRKRDIVAERHGNFSRAFAKLKGHMRQASIKVDDVEFSKP